MGNSYRPAYVSEILAALNGKPNVDLYVYIQHANRYLVFLRKDQELSTSKRDNLSRLSANSLFVEEEETSGAFVESKIPPSNTLSFLDPNSSFRNEILGPEAGEILHEAYRELLSVEEAPVGDVAQRLIGMSEEILEALAPETEDLKKSVIKNLANLNVMNDAAAITSLALLAALANDFNSRTALRQLSQACLFMDISLGDLDEHHLNQYYQDRNSLPSHIHEIIRVHPVKSQQLIARLPEISDSVGQMVLLHHELHNGKGYHRGIRTANVLPLARILAFAVDLYERIKREKLNKGSKNLRNLLVEFREVGIDPHQRRHAIGIIDNVLKYLKIT